jgi:thiol-disulfide isomerase/thioredoxin
LDRVEMGVPPTQGVPHRVFVFHAAGFALYTIVVEIGVVYIWKEDCKQCDIVMRELNSLNNDYDVDLVLFAVYGPTSPKILKSQYMVVGAPTILFLKNGVIDSRLQGARSRDILEAELEIISG